MPGDLFQRVLDALPQTQCTRCGYPDCAAYARAVADGTAGINQCPPGGRAGVERLAAITQRPALPLSPEHGVESPRAVAYIDENWCIGCTLCIKACPTDAIVGANKRMHTVIEAHCTGCELCLPVCPVDCILLENATGERTGWAAWSPAEAQAARGRYEQRLTRLAREELAHHTRQDHKAQEKLQNLAAHSKITDPVQLDHKRAVIEAALARARAARAPRSP
ncbi:MAG: hypothetical protein RJA09_2443 [Pseudomonadota bacterium]